MFSPVSALKIVLFFVCYSEKQHKKQQNKHRIYNRLLLNIL